MTSELTCKVCGCTIGKRSTSLMCKKCSDKARRRRRAAKDVQGIDEQKHFKSRKLFYASEMNYGKAMKEGLSMNLGSIAQYQDDRVEMMEAMKLSPFSITDSQNNGAIVFVDKHNATKLKEIAHKIHHVEEIAPPSPPNHPTPRRYIGNPCFDKILQSSRYKAVKDIEWREFDNDISAFFNVSWQLKKAMRVAIPALFSGALLVEDHQLLYITCVEAYCRSAHIDVHCEHYVGAESSQSDPEISYNKHDLYNGVCIKAAHEYNTAHIRIGLRTANLLVVGSIRVDVEDKASLGIANNIFKPTKYTRLFFDPRSIQKAEQLVKDNITEIQGAYDYARLRQLRSKFDDKSTYYMCRAAADGFLAHQNWPITIWTYADIKTKSDKASSTKIASSLFVEVATCVFEQKLLSRETVEQIHAEMETAASNIKKGIIQRILELFGEETEMPIILNKNLCRLLKELACSMQQEISAENIKRTSYLVKALKSIAVHERGSTIFDQPD